MTRTEVTVAAIGSATIGGVVTAGTLFYALTEAPWPVLGCFVAVYTGRRCSAYADRLGPGPLRISSQVLGWILISAGVLTGLISPDTLTLILVFSGGVCVLIVGVWALDGAIEQIFRDDWS